MTNDRELLESEAKAQGFDSIFDYVANLKRSRDTYFAERNSARDVARRHREAISRLEAAAAPELSREDVVRMAREAGLCMANDEWPLMERFAALVRSAPVGEVKPVATFQGRRLTPVNTREFWGWLADGIEDLPVGAPLFTTPPAPPEGMVMVPVEPTAEMKGAGHVVFQAADDCSPTAIYRAMLAAAPQPGGKE